MKAFLLDRYGKQRPLQPPEVPVPALRDDEVLVEVLAAGVNLIDNQLRKGEFKLCMRHDMPLILGHDLAGGVVKVGPRVRQFKIGDEVCARVDDLRIGTFAEFIPIKESSLALKPKTLTRVEAATLPLVGLMAWQALVEKAALKKGQTVFIQAGSGSVGSFCHPVGQASGGPRCHHQHGQRRHGQATGRRQRHRLQDAGLRDCAARPGGGAEQPGPQDVAKSLRVLKPCGKLISISVPADPAFARHLTAPAPLRAVIWLLSAGIRRQARSRGVDYRLRFMKAEGSQLREIAQLVDAGTIRPVIDKVYPFAATNEALAHVEGGRAKGKVVVSMRCSRPALFDKRWRCCLAAAVSDLAPLPTSRRPS